MKKDILRSFIIALVYITIGILSMVVDVGFNEALFLPIFLALYIGTMAQSHVVFGILLIFGLLLTWLVVFLIIKLMKFLRRMMSKQT